MPTSDRETGWARCVVGVGAAGAAALLAACTLIVDTEADQCMTPSDCDRFPGFRSCPTQGPNSNVCVSATSVPTCKTSTDCAAYAQASCDTSTGLCTRPCSSSSDCGMGGLTCDTAGQCTTGGSDGGPCAVNADCSGRGDTFVCRKSRCVDLVTPLCTTLHTTTDNPADALEDDNAVIFGSILPTGNPSAAPFGHLVEDAIKLALDDFGRVDGIPGPNGAAARPLVLVGCNDGPDEAASQTDVAANHLIQDLGVPAIIGYAFSGNTLSVARDVTIPDDVLLFSPSATSAQITDLEATDHDLVWRTCPSDDVQARALVLHYADVEAEALARYPSIDPSHIKVAIVNHSDAYGSGLGDLVQSTLTFNGLTATDPANTGCAADSGAGGPTDPSACYLRVDYGPSTNPDLTKIAVITAFEPDIIFLFGLNEGPDTIFKDVEAEWVVPADGHLPLWIFSDGGKVTSLWATHRDPNDPSVMDPPDIVTEDQRERVSGSVPGPNATSWPPYGTFLTEFAGSAYAGDGSADTLGPAGAYDITYLLAFSTVMVSGDGPQNALTGPNLVRLGLQRMQKGASLPMIQVGADDILSAFPTLALSAPVDISGVSGPLPFTGMGDITTADIQIWCVPKSTPPDSDVGSSAVSSGYFFDSATDKMAGCLSKTCALPMNPKSCM